MLFERLRTDKRIMKERLPVGLFALIGKQGAGKTSCGSAFMCNDYKYHSLERYNECKQFTDYLNSNGFNLHLAKNKCLYFSPEAVLLDKKRGISTWDFDVECLKLPNLKEEVQYFPRYSVIFVPEFDNIINCRDWKNMSPYLVALAKYARHWDLTIIIDFQCWLQIDKSWRNLMMYTLFFYETYDGMRFSFIKKIFHIPIKRYWRYIWVDNQLNTFVNELKTSVVSKKIIKRLEKRISMDKKYVFKGNIFNRFDSQSGWRYFVNGIKDYVFRPHTKNDISPLGVLRYCESHPLERKKKVA